MTDTTATFNFDEWVGNAKRRSRTITVYRDPTLEDEARRLRREIQEYNKSTHTGTEREARAAQLEAQQDDLSARITASRAEVTITALSDSEAEDIATQHAKLHGTKTPWDQTITGTCMAMEKVAAINGEQLTAEQWKALADGPLAGGQWQQLKATLLLVTHEVPAVPERRSRLRDAYPEEEQEKDEQ